MERKRLFSGNIDRKMGTEIRKKKKINFLTFRTNFTVAREITTARRNTICE